jgi:beta-glucuronidase
MIPYPHHELRNVIDLNDLWDFAFLGPIDPRTINPMSVSCDDRMPVPLAFDATPRYAGKRGTAIYRKKVSIPAHQAARLRFGAVGMWCAVFIDGQKRVEHGDGYTEFWVDLPPAAATVREIAVVVDNQFNSERNPVQLDYYDWYHYGGLYRPVYLQLLSPVFLQRVQVAVKDWRKGVVTARVEWGGAVASSIALRIEIDGRSVHEGPVAVLQGRSELTVTVPDPTPWTPEHPALHRLRFSTQEDDLIVRIGLREIKVHGREIHLNGTPLKLKGFCRHEAHPQFGPALPPALLLEDLHQLKDLGCNFIRGSHYPQDQRFLDLCDELGFLVWEEATGWGNKTEHFQDEYFCAAQERCVTEMITASFNHPSVILWGFLNEGDTAAPAGKVLYQRLADRCRALDATRPVTFADMHVKSICLPIADVISYNLYPAWYGDHKIEDIPVVLRERIAIARKLTGDVRPFLVSEIGAGAIYGWRDGHASRWSEQYQAKLLDTVCAEVLANADILGISIWQFCDMRTTEQVTRVLGRPRAFNNKGVVDEWRRPKEAYFTVKARFRGERAP